MATRSAYPWMIALAWSLTVVPAAWAGKKFDPRDSYSADPGTFTFHLYEKKSATPHQTRLERNGRTLPRVVNFQSKLLYYGFEYNQLWQSDIGGVPKDFKYLRSFSWADSFTDRPRIAVVGNQVYAGNFSESGIFMHIGTPRGADPEDIDWRTETSPRPANYGFGDGFQVEMESLPVINEKDQTVSNNLYAVFASHAHHGLYLARYHDGKFETVLHFEPEGAVNIPSLSVARVQLGNGTYRLVIGWVELTRGTVYGGGGDAFRWRLALFDGSEMKEVDAARTAQPQQPTGIRLASGSLFNGTTRQNVLQIFLEDGGYAKNYAMSLLRAEYDLRSGNGLNGSMNDIGNGPRSRKLVSVIAGSEVLCNQLDSDGPISSEGHMKDKRYESIIARNNNFVAYSYVWNDGPDARVDIGLLGASQGNYNNGARKNRLILMARQSNRLLRTSFVEKSGKWESSRDGEPSHFLMTDPRSWLYLGALYGVPPYSWNGHDPSDDIGNPSTVRIAASGGREKGTTVTSTNTVSPSFSGSFFGGLLGVEGGYSEALEKKKGASTEAATTIGHTFQAPTAGRANSGYLFFLKPTLEVQAFKIADWQGNIIPNHANNTGAMMFYHTKILKWDLTYETFPIGATKRSQLKRFARGIRTVPGLSSNQLARWRPIADDPSYDIERGNLLQAQAGQVAADFSKDLAEVKSSSRTITRSWKVEGFFKLFGLGYDGSFATETTEVVSRGISFAFNTQLRAPSSDATGTTYRRIGITPVFLRQKKNHRAFFTPDLYATQDLQPFCVTYEVNRSATELSPKAREREANVRLKAVHRVLAAVSSPAFAETTTRSFAASALLPGVMEEESAEDAPTSISALSTADLRVTTEKTLHLDKGASPEVCGTADAKTGKVLVTVRYRSHGSGNAGILTRYIPVAANKTWSFRLPPGLGHRQLRLTFRAVTDSGAISRPVRVIAVPKPTD